MGTIQKLSSQVIDYAERVSDMADAAQGKHHQRAGLPNRWLLLPASGAALLALVKSDALSRQAKQVMEEAKARASELPDDLLSMVHQSASNTSSRNGSGTSPPPRRGGSPRANRIHARALRAGRLAGKTTASAR